MPVEACVLAEAAAHQFAQPEGDRRRREAKQHLPSAGFQQRNTGRECNTRSNDEQANGAQRQADRDDGQAATKGKWRNGNDGSSRKQQKGGDGCLPGRSSQFARLNAKLLAGQGIQSRILVSQQPIRQALRFRLPQTLRLIDQGQLFALFFGNVL